MPARTAKTPPPRALIQPPTSRVVASWLFPAYLLVIFIGYLLMHSSAAMNAGNEMGSSQALFTSINAATLTGFPQSYDLSEFQPTGQITVFLLIMAGSLFSLVIGGMAATRILRLPYSDRRVITAALIAEASALIFGSLLLLFDAQRSIPQAIFLAASAFGNCALTLGHLPAATDWQTPVVLLPLITLGGLGLPVLMELYDHFTHHRPLSFHSRLVLHLTAWLFIAGTATLTFLRWTGTDSWRYTLDTSAVLTIDSRTAGLAWLPRLHIPASALCAVLVLMSIGGASAGTAGGIKFTTLAELFRQLARLFTGKRTTRSLGISASAIAIFALLVWLTYFLLMWKKIDLNPHESLLKAFSAVSNCGLVVQAIPKGFAQFYILSAAMLAGRFASLSLIWWLADTTSDADVAIG